MFKFPGPWTSPRENLKRNFLVCPWYASYPRASENLLICVSQKSVEWTLHPKTNLKRQSAHEKILSVIRDASVLGCFSRVRLFATLWTVARQASLSVGFTRQEYWSGLPCLSLGDLPDWPRNWTGVSYVSCNGGRIFFLPLAPPGKPHN